MPQRANDKTRFARVGHTTKALHKQVRTMLTDKSQGTIRTAAYLFDLNLNVLPSHWRSLPELVLKLWLTVS